MQSSKKLIVIAGPTASGKTDLAIQLAQHFKTAIVSADSRQCYRELNIGVAKPTNEQLNAVQHYFINSHSIHEHVNVGQYEREALAYLDEIFAKNTVAIVCGGTGLYIKALCEGIDIMPEVDKELSRQINDAYRVHGRSWLQAELAQHDPLFFEKGEMQNPARMLRALSFVKSCGHSILTFHQHQQVQRPFEIVKYVVSIPRELLYERINERVLKMMAQGLLEEVKDLLPYAHLKNLNTVGYSELFQYFNGEIDLQQAVALIQQNTRHYAKRQLTWFKKDSTFIWAEPVQILKELQT